MSRDLTAGMVTEVTAPKSQPIAFYEGEFSGSTVRLWTGLGTVPWNGQDWQGAGSLLSISPITETADVRAQGITCALSGNVSSLIAKVLSEARLGKPGTVWLGFLDANGAIVADPYLAFRGRLDVPTIDDAGQDSMISISYENELMDLRRSRERRWTAEDAKIDYPDERGFDFVASLPDQNLLW